MYIVYHTLNKLLVFIFGARGTTQNNVILLLVPESPVEVSVSPPSYETDLILRNLGNFPIDIRQRGYLNQKGNVYFP
jgi:hypothetical protein